MRRLYIDDIRNPHDYGWETVRSSQEAISWVLEHGMPLAISFDHDLGGDDTSRVFVSWMIDALLDGKIELPVGFEYKVHSANPVGSAWIDGTMTSVLKHFAKKEM